MNGVFTSTDNENNQMNFPPTAWQEHSKIAKKKFIPSVTSTKSIKKKKSDEIFGISASESAQKTYGKKNSDEIFERGGISPTAARK